ncbi:hypothetical protein [Flavilitoribacter nigricans]|uniref:Cupin n=1 Tax=Flavilitoribacter nigricans (strain ATCC 23147 / DSM 23189 / NBRC 102662 / NCIMB 1420 / SS-2) TaxID=1122177 RepID=A0A2D0NFY7_FLAN2|nr:hypothetical protein [Flavilitoribacter nigricans]PHN07300.1 hypothetical protein CRP01_06625 [Flavilitoribacter nigricans DSM 23189 = NBRC 102662]
MKIRTKHFFYTIGACLALCLVVSCQTSKPDQEQEAQANTPTQEDQMKVVKLSAQDTSGFESIRKSFVTNNPGYDLHYHPQTTELEQRPVPRLAFLQTGGGTAIINDESSKISVGDIINIPAGARMETDSLVDLLVFDIPEAPPTEIPVFIRPDWDPNITDTPGGCATETNAYRRILLTWEGRNGPYLYHALNAHRVRIMNSFTHYHPLEGGFDEFYLVQMAQAKAKIITSEKVDLITEPGSVTKEDLPDLLQQTPLDVGDLVYLPRGVAHRGLDGVLAQVITVPGFIPGSEIGIDHHLKAISDRLSLEGEERLPYHEEAAETVVVK